MLSGASQIKAANEAAFLSLIWNLCLKDLCISKKPRDNPGLINLQKII
jgi:hypothetical protein